MAGEARGGDILCGVVDREPIGTSRRTSFNSTVANRILASSLLLPQAPSFHSTALTLAS